MSAILVVDDESVTTRLMKRRLEAAGHRVETASDGNEALQKLDSQKFDGLITDVCMPGMGGKELCEEVQKNGSGNAPLIFVISSRPEVEFRSWTREFSEVEFIEKPVSPNRLIKRLEERLSGAAKAEEAVP